MTRVPPSVWRKPLHFVAFGFGSGASSVLPGTAGTLVAVPLYWLLQDLALWNYLLVVFVAFIVGIGICGRTAQDIGVHDHPGIVWDEFVGYLVTMIMAPQGWWWLVIGFILFRLFDMYKPWPINLIDRHVPGGLGIMLDDVLAGVYALCCLQLLAYLLLRYGIA